LVEELEAVINGIADFNANHRLGAAAVYKYTGLFGMVCWTGNNAAIKMMVTYGADVNRRQGRDTESATPLMICAIGQNVIGCHFLLTNGALMDTLGALNATGNMFIAEAHAFVNGFRSRTETPAVSLLRSLRVHGPDKAGVPGGERCCCICYKSGANRTTKCANDGCNRHWHQWGCLELEEEVSKCSFELL
jgi:hypothetical protein